MARPAALRVALDLAATPVLASLAARQPLPPDMITALKIAGGSPTALQEAVATTGEPPERIREAVILFLQTALFTLDADSYRILGAERSAAQTELRDHMRWLMKWLHPDHERSEWEASLALKVSAAWDDLKSPDRRRQYDAEHPAPSGGTAAFAGSDRRRPRRGQIPWVRHPLPQPIARPNAIGRILTFGAMILAGVGLVASLWVWAGFLESFDWSAGEAAAVSQAGAVADR